ncbi:hypothetical protein HPB49_004893 [Dermacentor silvarum]|uniref:Uncharacterized protein n=1 Tax=Dermacentor silvarum TaxID=543639 RepID=A0ACB8C273_DERSI|nr:hypothetical protein HPB49_004893 [Dermacentor silvarum]
MLTQPPLFWVMLHEATLLTLNVLTPTPRISPQKITAMRRSDLSESTTLRWLQGDEWRRIRSQTHTSVSAPHVLQRYADGIARVVDDTVSLISSVRDEKGEVEDCHVLMRRNITNVVGCVDGTHVGIKAPSRSNPEVVKANCFTRKAHYALNTMVVCDADLRILDIDARFRGSCHDAHVWEKTALRRHFELGLLVEDGDWLLGKYFFPKWLDPL